MAILFHRWQHELGFQYLNCTLFASSHLEKFARLRLKTLGCIDKHDGIISGRQGTICVLGKILRVKGPGIGR